MARIETINPEIVFAEVNIERFKEKIDVADSLYEDYDQCWIYKSNSKSRYPLFAIFRDLGVTAHRYSYSLFKNNKKIPSISEFVCHKCDNKRCVNPNHLYLGNHDDNMNDMVNRNRQAKGKDNGAAKLTEKQILEIREYLNKPGWTTGMIAVMFGVSRKSIDRVMNNEYWTHVN